MPPRAPRKPDVVVAAQHEPADKANSAAFIFIHGFGDEAATLAGVARQFQAANKLPHMQWIIPDAPEHHEAMSQAWYRPSPLTPFAPSRPELEDEEDEEGMAESVAYFVSIIDGLVAQGVPAKRIVIGGFSQGCAMSLLVGLTTKYAGKLGGVVGIAGYLPIEKRVVDMRREAGLPEKAGDEMPFYFCRGTRDMLVPKRYFTICVNKLKEVGVDESAMDLHEYEGMGHQMSGLLLRDVCTFLEKALPPIET